MVETPSFEPQAHTVGARPDGVFACEKARDLGIGKIVVLRARDGADPRRRPQIEPFDPAFVAVVSPAVRTLYSNITKPALDLGPVNNN